MLRALVLTATVGCWRGFRPPCYPASRSLGFAVHGKPRSHEWMQNKDPMAKDGKVEQWDLALEAKEDKLDG